MSEPIHGIRVFWIPQVPMEPFHQNCSSIHEARAIEACLANYDTFQFEHNIKPDYCNTGGIEVQLSNGEWEDYDPEHHVHLNPAHPFPTAPY